VPPPAKRPTRPATRGGAKPAAAPAEGAAQTAVGSFVIQEHHARSLHWDLRLERDGVYVSWAVPKGLPTDRGVNHLAVHVEDHPLEYGTFEGTIPKGEYGAGEVAIWDHGTYEADKWTDREVKFHLHGSRIDARFALFQTDGANWMVHRVDPAPEGWQQLPDLVKPMLAVAGDLPADEAGWSYEFKWDGIRALAYVEGGRVRFLTRNDRDTTEAYPELRPLGEALGSRQVVLDGEIIALDAEGRPSFEALQGRMHLADSARARRLAQQSPVTYMLFDLLHLDGRSTLDLPYHERRRLLEELALQGERWAVPPSHPGPGADLLAAARASGLEGVVAKRTDAPYRPGRRSAEWVKVKVFRTQEVVVGGWSAGKGSRERSIGALLAGIPSPGGGLQYAGKVGTGFSEAALADLQARLEPLRTDRSPFTTPVPKAEAAGATWVEPTLVGEVRFAEWTTSGRLRHPSWRGLRTDKDPQEVVREP
jgi:bifunctional non-homologous end joining protein LigD